jgi:hypothetical protein
MTIPPRFAALTANEADRNPLWLMPPLGPGNEFGGFDLRLLRGERSSRRIDRRRVEDVTHANGLELLQVVVPL